MFIINHLLEGVPTALVSVPCTFYRGQPLRSRVSIAFLYDEAPG